MWSLHDIIRLNNEAAEAAKNQTYEQQAANPKEHQCLVCEWNGDETPADHGYVTHDIFSDDAKGVIFVCEEHDGYTGSPVEGYFTCGDCYRVMAENYTWERYSTIVGCEQLCLPCALKAYIAEESNWVPLDEIERVIVEAPKDEDDPIYDPATATLNLAKAPHLIAVQMPVPDTIHFEKNLEFDSSTGEMLASTSSTYARGVGESAALEAIQELRDQGYSKALVILDAAYQFSVSIGIYVSAQEHRAIEAEPQEQVREVLHSEG